MNIMKEKILPILKCKAGHIVELDKGAAMFLINGGLIQARDIKVTVTRLVLDEKGKPVKDDDGKHIKEETLTQRDALTSVTIEYTKRTS